MKIWFNIPWSQEKNLGNAYNDFMELIPEDDYACFIDGDAMFLTTYFGSQIYDIVNKYPECGIFTCKTNRIGCIYQREKNMWLVDEMQQHRSLAALNQKDSYHSVKDITNLGTDEPMGGVLILISKKVWKKIGGFADGILGVDNKLHWSCIKNNEKVYLMEGVYIYHWYRGGDPKNNLHLK